jgi:ABC-2 type transport system ATP-binding protein
MTATEAAHRAQHGEREPVIVVGDLIKRFGTVTAVDNVSFDVWPGTIVALLGPRGSGKTTVLRALLGMIEPTSGTARFWKPQTVVGTNLDGEFRESAGTATARLCRMAADMLRTFAFEGASLGDTEVLVLDEPATGLDPASARWLGTALRNFVGTGKSVLLSASSTKEIEDLADEVVVLDAGRIIISAPVDELLAGADRLASIRVRTPDAGLLADALAARGRACIHLGNDTIRVHDTTAAELRRFTADAGVVVYETTFEHPSLETVIAGLGR